jgi:uncharacterized RDD family membrane protein YckC
MSETANPFEPPKADWSRRERDDADDDELGDLVAARQGTRLANSLLDTVFQVVTALLVTGPDWYSIVFFFYYLGFEALFGKTPAKWITGTRVVTTRGRRPRFAQILGRTFTRLVPFEAFSFLGRKASGWHDTWSGTRVVYERSRRLRRRRRRRTERSE